MRDGIRKDGNNWEANVTVYGERIFRNFPTKTEAKTWRAQQIADASRETWIAPTKTTVGEAIDMWLLERKRRVSPKTYENYKGQVAHCPDRAMPLREVRPFHIDRWVEVVDEEVGRASANLLLKRMKTVFKYAIKNRLIRTNPAEDVGALPSTTKEKEPLTREELADVLPRLGDPYRDVVTTLAFTGMRIGDCLALTVADVDVLKARVHIGNEKSGRKGHWVPLVGPAREVVLRLASEHEHFLFPGQVTGTHISKQAVRTHLLRATSHLGRGVSPHTLRHTFATWALQSGAPITSVSKWLGHANVTETLNTYSHLMPDDFDAVASVIELAWESGDKVGNPPAKPEYG